MFTVALQIILLFGLSTLPTLLYPQYAQTFHLSELTLTVMYALYVVGTVITLFFFGRLSDIFGRRRIAFLSVGIAMAATGLFMASGSAFTIALARIVSGFAVGLSSGTALAWMRDLHGRAEADLATKKSVALNIFGLGFGPLLAGTTFVFGPQTQTLPYIVFLVLLVILLLFLKWAPETVKSGQRFRAELLKPRIGVPANLRIAFLVPAITIFVAFSLVGFYSAIAPNVLANTLGVHSKIFEGYIIFELFLAGIVATLAGTRMPSRSAMLAGIACVIPGLVCVVAAEATASLWLMLVGTAVSGCAVGLGYRGSLEIVNRISPVEHRAEMISALFVVGNGSISIPVIGVGLVATLSTFWTANIMFAAVLIVFAIIGLFFAQRLAVLKE